MFGNQIPGSVEEASAYSLTSQLISKVEHSLYQYRTVVSPYPTAIH
jgi:hypothetical protein